MARISTAVGQTGKVASKGAGEPCDQSLPGDQSQAVVLIYPFAMGSLRLSDQLETQMRASFTVLCLAMWEAEHFLTQF